MAEDGLKRMKFPEAKENQEPKGGNNRRALVQPYKLPMDGGKSTFQIIDGRNQPAE